MKTNPLIEFFLINFVHSGSLCQTCECGKFHIASHDRGCFDEGEFESYVEKAKASDKYVFHDYSSVEWGEIEGQTFCMDCDCLNERFNDLVNLVWLHRDNIIKFITKQNNYHKSIINNTDRLLSENKN